MSKLDDIRHLRERGFWVANIIPQWALDESAARNVPPDDLRILFDAAWQEAESAASALTAAIQRFQQAASEVATELIGLAGRIKPVPFARQDPPIGPLLLVIGANVIGIARWRSDRTLNLLGTEPPGAERADFARWISLPELLKGA
jgi:hypothetical protein